jgi:alkylation response protein AidB-like acyl-CoA dehydrogenase
MTLFEATPEQRRFLDVADDLAERYLKPRADEVDRTAEFPRHNFDEIAKAGLFGLRIPEKWGGMGADYLTAVKVIERLSQACGSTGMCFKMHCESTEVIWQLADSDYKVEHFVKPVARGEKLVTSAISEAGSGSHTWALQSYATPADGGYELTEVHKGWVTSSGHADFYMTPILHHKDAKPGQFTAFVIEKDKVEWSIDAPWNGLGMRANASSPMSFKGFLPAENRFGPEEGWGQHVAGPIFVPFSYLTFAAVFLGIAEGAFEACMDHVTGRAYTDGSGSLAKIDGIQRNIGEMRISIDRSRALIYEVASMVDRGDIDTRALMEAVCAADETAAEVANAAMQVGGGKSYSGANSLGRFFRDAMAGRVMAPSDDVIKLRVARILLGLPQF